MDGENTNMQMGFDAGAAGGGDSSTPADSTPATQDAGNSTTEGSAADNGTGSIPPAGTAPAAEKTIAASEKGSFKLVYNERTGRNEVVSTMPQETEEEPETGDDEGDAGQAKPQQQQQVDPNAYQGNELLKTAQNLASGQQLPPQPAANNEYTLEQLQEAMRVGHVDESRIPINLRQGYYLARAGQGQPPQQQQAEPKTGVQTPEETAAMAQDFYSKVNEMAQQRAMKEIGITQEEIDLAEYSDDEKVLNKFSTYKSALENHKQHILREVETIQRNQQAFKADRDRAYQAVAGFVQEMRQKDKNFEEIDKYVLQRVEEMPHKEAAKVVPLIEKVRSGRLTTADLPALQEMYNQARLEYYSKKKGISLAPQPTKPPFVEQPGNAKETPKQQPPLSALGTMNRRDKMRAIGQLVGKMFAED